jgi:hypothetical protein
MMVNIEINKKHEFFSQLILEYPTAPVIEINSFGADTIASILIPLAAILAPTVSPLIIKLISDRNVSIKYEGIEVSGDYKHIKEIIKQIQQEQKNGSVGDDKKN